MTQQSELTQISETRGIVSQLVGEQAISRLAALNARDTVLEMCRRAAEYGLTEAEVVKALLGPVFERKPGCDCPTCKARRASGRDGTPIEEALNT